jgi:hypothetical protein
MVQIWFRYGSDIIGSDMVQIWFKYGSDMDKIK